MWVHIFIITTPHMINYDKNCLKCCNISIVLNINLLQYRGNMAIHVHYVTSCWAQRPKLKRSEGELSRGELIFYSKNKSFQYFQCQAASVSVLQSRGELRKLQKQIQNKERESEKPNHIHNKVQQKKERGRWTEKKKKKRKEEEEEEAVASRRHPYFVVVFFLFSFFLFSFLTNETFHVSARYPFTDRNSWTSPVQSVHGQYDWYFFRNEIRGVICISALAGTVRYEIDFLDVDHLLTLNMVAPRCVYLPFPYYFLPLTIARTPLMQLSFYKYKCLWGGVRGGF